MCGRDGRPRAVLLRAATFVALACTAIRLGGVAARAQRDRYLRFLVSTGVRALNGHESPSGDGDGGREHLGRRDGRLAAFIDWSTLLSQWREGGFFDDEEDADLGVVVPPALNSTSVAEILREATRTERELHIIDEPPGRVFVEPLYNRLHLDLYLVRGRRPRPTEEAAFFPERRRGDDGEESERDQHGRNGGGECSMLDPMWPPPERSDSHAAFVHPRPYCGLAELNGWPVPSNVEGYLGSIFGHLGANAVYVPATGLYREREAPPRAPSVVARLSGWASAVVHLLSRDVYFMVIMTPLSEDFRTGVEAQYDGLAQALVRWWCGPDSNFRDCFH